MGMLAKKCKLGLVVGVFVVIGYAKYRGGLVL